MTDQEAAGGVGVRMVAVSAEQGDQRIDNFLLRELKGVPKSRVYRLLRKGEVRVNRSRVKADYRVQPGDQVRIPPVRTAQAVAPARPSAGLSGVLAARILYEDAGLLIVDKPAGLAVHGGSGLDLGLIEALRAMRPEAPFLELVHRLDRDTSGCVMIAKKRSALRSLHAMLRGTGITKVYWALADGRWPAHTRRVDAPLAKNVLKSGERLVKVAAEGRPALTEFAVLERFARATLVEARPITGRTHQIRVHAKQAGHALLGDEKYGQRDANAWAREQGLKRLFLHASRLELPWEGARLAVSAPLGPELEAVLQRLRAQGGRL
ncbi:MAG TPA: 23S rRNA pseudouridine(955/2504/2580) synthase RluC [Spongiibacteraceae bacterium]|jgi:23S rRNA pseudouridine955/2504/2580 synthase|nr:23S rRNA pseudouridine(955/2504/2580) synthase RluC [Spongiibacteraceae bacterium]HUH37363.1 23S rRNA pseudouridine(955/2504/2580) synthase RluC [Spongiibacteraceae bacterium]